MKGISDKVREAMDLALVLHREQLRKGTQVPYVAHLWAVAGLVAEHGGDEEQMIGGLLHDAIEDQGSKITLGQIRDRFGERVARIVEGCTDAYVTPKPPWSDRKREFLKRLYEQADRDVMLVIAADKLHNARDLVRRLRTEGAGIWEAFNAGPEEQLTYYRTVLAVIQSKLNNPIVEDLERAVNELERHIRASSSPGRETPSGGPPRGTGYPKIDRSDFTPNFQKTAENDVLDIGWYEGVLSDGRPVRMEYWCQDQVSSLTYFFSSLGLEQATRDFFKDFLVREGLLKFTGEKRYVGARLLVDPSGNEMWSVNVVLGDEDETYVRDIPSIKQYLTVGTILELQ